VIGFLLAQADAVGVGGPSLVPSLWRTVGALAVVLAMIAVAAWLLRRGVLARRTGKGLAVESALSLGERRSLVVVMVEGRRLLLGLAPNSVALVTELDRTASFDQALTQAGAAAETRPS
jgi:flagellar protein FliO/FliZ